MVILTAAEGELIAGEKSSAKAECLSWPDVVTHVVADVEALVGGELVMLLEAFGGEAVELLRGFAFQLFVGPNITIRAES